jgi:hypothetical protein
MNRRQFMGAAAAVPAAAALPLIGDEEKTLGPGIYKCQTKTSEDPSLYFQFGDGEKFELGNVGDQVTFMLQPGGQFTFDDGKGNTFVLGLG